jgi:chemotaxis protein methyltransferase CheR
VSAALAPAPPRASDADCVRFLEWALPRLRLRWPGFRRVRGQVGKRLRRRLAALGLPDLAAYRGYLEAHPSEWPELDALCRISISRFYRDRGVFDALGSEVLPALARAARDRGEDALRIWSAGCASGEEPYTAAILWREALAARFPSLSLRIVATDVDESLLARARAARYTPSSLRELPPAWRARWFRESGAQCVLDPELTRTVELGVGDLRVEQPSGPFHLALCRNVAFTYFEEALQRDVLRRIAGVLLPRGALAIGLHESLPEGQAEFEPWDRLRCVYRRRA